MLANRSFGFGFLLVAFLGLGWIVAPDPAAYAASWRLEPGLSWRTTYDDNILFEDASDLESRIRPGVELSRRTERSQLRFSGTADIINYLDYSRYDRINQDYRLQSRYASSPRLSFNLSSRVAIDHTFDEFWEQDGLVSAKSKRYAYSLSPGLSLALDERTSLSCSLQGSLTDYEQDVNPDYNVLGASLSLARSIWDGRTELLARGSAQRSDYDLGQHQDSEQRVYRLLLGIRHSITETLQASFSIGPMWIQSRYEHPLFRLQEDNLSYALQGSLDWRLERTRLGLDLSRSEAQSTYGENITRDRLTARMSREISQRWRFNCRGSVIQSKTQGYISKRDRQALNLKAGMSYALSQRMDLSLGYNYRLSRDRIDKDTDTGNRVYAQLAVRFPQQW